MARISGFGYVINPVASDDERLILKFHNENVAITGMSAFRNHSGDPSKITLALSTNLGEAQLEMTPAFAKQLIAAVGGAVGD
jgi:hypothetical protein